MDGHRITGNFEVWVAVESTRRTLASGLLDSTVTAESAAGSSTTQVQLEVKEHVAPELKGRLPEAWRCVASWRRLEPQGEGVPSEEAKALRPRVLSPVAAVLLNCQCCFLIFTCLFSCNY